jgi:hypothetical protein
MAPCEECNEKKQRESAVRGELGVAQLRIYLYCATYDIVWTPIGMLRAAVAAGGHTATDREDVAETSFVTWDQGGLLHCTHCNRQ